MTKSSRPLIAAATCLVMLPACAGPDLSKEIYGFQVGVGALREELDPIMQPLAQNERAAEHAAGRAAFVADAKTVEAEKKVEALLVACRAYFSRDVRTSLSQCGGDLHPPVPHPDFLWSASADFLNALETYIAEVAALAGSTAPQEIVTNSARLAASTAALLAESGDTAGAARLDNLAQPTSGLIGALVRARKARVLRTAITRADGAIATGTQIVASGIDQLRPSPPLAFDRLVTAQRALVDALDDGTPQQRLAAAEEFERARSVYLQAERASPVFALMQMAHAHHELAGAAARGATTEELLSAIKAVGEFLTAVKG